MACCQQDTTSSFVFPDDVAGCWCTHDTILTKQHLLDAICCTNLDDQLHDLRVVISPISTNDQVAAICAFGDGLEDAGDERL